MDKKKKKTNISQNFGQLPHQPQQRHHQIVEPQQSVIPSQPENPLLAKVFIPGETFALPSGGNMYTDGELDETVINGEIIINPMVTYEEIVLKTPDKLLNGTGIVEVLRRCAPQIRKPLQLFAKDLDYVLICLRKMSFGGEISVTYTHECDNKEYNYVVSLDELIAKTKKINPQKIETEYKTVLPNGQVITVAPPRYEQVLSFFQIYSQNKEEMDTALVAEQIIKNSVGIVQSVDNIFDKKLIREWVEALPPGYLKQIAGMIDNAAEWGPNMKVKKECKNCHQEIELEILLNPISFFS